MSLPHPLPDDLAVLIARRFRAIGEPMRIRLLDLLRDGERSVGELAEALGTSQQNVSKHLAVLADVGVLGRRKEANRVYYRIVDRAVLDLCEQVCGSLQEQLAALSTVVGRARPLTGAGAVPEPPAGSPAPPPRRRRGTPGTPRRTRG